MSFGERLIDVRKEHGYTREALAQELGISKFTLRNYELEATEPGHTFLKQISDFFNVSVDYLMELSEEKERMNLRSFPAPSTSLIVARLNALVWFFFLLPAAGCGWLVSSARSARHPWYCFPAARWVKFCCRPAKNNTSHLHALFPGII